MKMESDKLNYSWYQQSLSCTIHFINETEHQIARLEKPVQNSGFIARKDDFYDPIQPKENKIYFCRKDAFPLTGCSGVLQFKVTDGMEERVVVVGYCNNAVKLMKSASNKASVGLYTKREFEKIREYLYHAVIGNCCDEQSASFSLKYSYDRTAGKARKGAILASVSVSEGDHCSVKIVLEDNPHYLPNLEEGEFVKSQSLQRSSSMLWNPNLRKPRSHTFNFSSGAGNSGYKHNFTTSLPTSPSINSAAGFPAQDNMEFDAPSLQNVTSTLRGVNLIPVDESMSANETLASIGDIVMPLEQNFSNHPHPQCLLQDLRELISKYESDACSCSVHSPALVKKLWRDINEVAIKHANADKIEDVLHDLKIVVNSYDSIDTSTAEN